MYLKDKLFLYIKEVIDRRKKIVFLLAILSFISVFYRLIAFVRNALYDLKILKQVILKKIKIISIGNIVAGGTGKTPFTIFLANHLNNASHLNKQKLAIITRGYKSKYENKSLIIDKHSKFISKDLPDEAMIFVNRVKEATVFIGKRKLLSIKKAQSLDFALAIIDDGFQTRGLKKDFEIVILNANEPFAKGYFLPRGYLRESHKSLKRSDFIVVNNAKNKILTLESEIRKYTNSPIIYTHPIANKFLDLYKNEMKLEKNAKVAIFSAIANPDHFFSTIKDLKFEIVNSLNLLDHAKIRDKQLDNFMQKSLKKGAKAIITTQKDAVKLDFNKTFSLPIVYLEIDLKITANEALFRGLVEKIMK